MMHIVVTNRRAGKPLKLLPLEKLAIWWKNGGLPTVDKKGPARMKSGTEDPITMKANL